MDILPGHRVLPRVVHAGRTGHGGGSEDLDALDRLLSFFLQAPDGPGEGTGVHIRRPGVSDHEIIFEVLPTVPVDPPEEPPKLFKRPAILVHEPQNPRRDMLGGDLEEP